MKLLLKQCLSILKECFLFIDRHKLLTRLDRYFLKEFFKTHFLTLVIVYIILLVNNFILMMATLITLQIRFIDILGLMISLTPSTILWALPFSVLLGTLLFISRLAQNNEITAAACLGINMLQLLKPFLIYGVCIGIGSYILDTGISPATNQLFFKIASRIAATAPHVLIESESSTLIGKTTLMTTGPLSPEGILKGITIIEKQPDGDTKVLHAKQGMLVKIKKIQESVLNLKEIRGIIASPNIDSANYQVVIADEALYRFNIKQSALGISTTMSYKTIGQTFKKFLISKKEFKTSELNKVVKGKTLQDDLGDLYLEANQYTHVANTELLYTFQNYKNSFPTGGFRINFLISIIEFYQKMSLIISSLIFIFFAFSLAISRNKIHQTTIMAIGGILCVSYWFSYHLTISLIISYQFSSLIIASSDAAFLIASFVLLRKVKL